MKIHLIQFPLPINRLYNLTFSWYWFQKAISLMLHLGVKIVLLACFLINEMMASNLKSMNCNRTYWNVFYNETRHVSNIFIHFITVELAPLTGRDMIFPTSLYIWSLWNWLLWHGKTCPKHLCMSFHCVNYFI